MADLMQAVPLSGFGSSSLVLLLISMSLTSVKTGDLNLYSNYNKFLQVDSILIGWLMDHIGGPCFASKEIF